MNTLQIVEIDWRDHIAVGTSFKTPLTIEDGKRDTYKFISIDTLGSPDNIFELAQCSTPAM